MTWGGTQSLRVIGKMEHVGKHVLNMFAIITSLLRKKDFRKAWFTVETLPGNSRPIWSYGDFVDDIVRDRLERVDDFRNRDVDGWGDGADILKRDWLKISYMNGSRGLS